MRRNPRQSTFTPQLGRHHSDWESWRLQTLEEDGAWWATTMRFFAGPRLLIIDEVGYLPLQNEAAAALFQVITQR